MNKLKWRVIRFLCGAVVDEGLPGEVPEEPIGVSVRAVTAVSGQRDKVRL